ncbi:MAG: histone deacetylase [Microcoleaceae cyanobacterium]
MVTVIYSDKFLQHKTGLLHPERPERLTAIVEAIYAIPLSEKIDWEQPTSLAECQAKIDDEILAIHTQDHINRVRQIAINGGGYLDGDTPLSPESFEVAQLAVSAWLDGVDRVIDHSQPTFILARPPGHHAESSRGMGFCVFSNAAIAAHYALKKPGIDRVAILDWDVHHGNGTQAIIEANPNLAYCSLHQSPAYPGTGFQDEQGDYNNVLNVPLYPGSTIAIYQAAFEQQVMPFLRNFQPDLLIVSAGYDANHHDPLASISLQPEDYGQLTDYCLQLTSKILLGLEGGYDLPSLSQSVVVTLERCLAVI